MFDAGALCTLVPKTKCSISLPKIVTSRAATRSQQISHKFSRATKGCRKGTFNIKESKSKSKKRKAESINDNNMGNVAASSTESMSDELSDRELARQLLDSKRKRAVQFSEPSVSASSGGADDSVSLHAADLRSNLMRVQKDRDPMFYYEIIKVVGVGSMGSVAMVKKRGEVIGGSARKKLVASLRRENKKNVCFKLPVVGDLFRHCFEALDGVKSNSSQALRPALMSQSSGTTSFAGDDNASSSSVGSKKTSVLYALKSIHLSRVTDQIYVEELKNEIEILKKLVSADSGGNNDDDDGDLILISYSFRIIRTSFVPLKPLFIKISCAL